MGRRRWSPTCRRPQIKRSAASPTSAVTSAQAQTAVNFALAQVGKPYVWGAAGPSSYDCSGLTMAAYRAAGISLPHSAADQYNYGHHVSDSDLQPGDLMFFYQPIGHVTIYIGNGLMVSAPQTGEDVKVIPADSGTATTPGPPGSSADPPAPSRMARRGCGGPSVVVGARSLRRAADAASGCTGLVRLAARPPAPTVATARARARRAVRQPCSRTTRRRSSPALDSLARPRAPSAPSRPASSPTSPRAAGAVALPDRRRRSDDRRGAAAAAEALRHAGAAAARHAAATSCAASTPLPAAHDLYLTFVARGRAHRSLAGDDALADARRVELARPVALRAAASPPRPASLVLGPPADRGAAAGHRGRDVDAAIAAVTAVWGTDWSRRVAVLVPASAAEFARAQRRRAGTDVSAAAVTDGIDPGNRPAVRAAAGAQPGRARRS